MNIAYNMDCLEAMREMKDNEFDLAVVDPPYGDALANESGGGGTGSEGGSTSTKRKIEAAVARTGGTWAEKYGKKS